MINLKDNEKIGYLMDWLRANYSREEVDAMVKEARKIKNASEFSDKIKQMLKKAEKAVGTYDGEPLFEKEVEKNYGSGSKSFVWKSIADKFMGITPVSITDIIFEEIEDEDIPFFDDASIPENPTDETEDGSDIIRDTDPDIQMLDAEEVIEETVTDDGERAKITVKVEGPTETLAQKLTNLLDRIVNRDKETEIKKFNPYHDEIGRFSTAEGGTTISLATPSDWQNKGSLARHIDLKTGKISAERQELYTKILTGLFDGVQKPEGQPQIEYMGGGSASGKSYVLNKTELLSGVPKGNKAVQINADDIKELLPEYKEMQESEDLQTRKSAAAYVHEESSMLAGQAVRMAIDLGYNVVVDGCAANPKKLETETDMAKEAGYSVNAHYIAAPMKQAIKSNKARFANENRYVPDTVVVDAHKKVSQNFETVANSDMFDSVEVITNEFGKTNEKIYQKKKGESAVISNEGEYRKFLNKANYKG